MSVSIGKTCFPLILFGKQSVSILVRGPTQSRQSAPQLLTTNDLHHVAGLTAISSDIRGTNIFDCMNGDRTLQIWWRNVWRQTKGWTSHFKELTNLHFLSRELAWGNVRSWLVKLQRPLLTWLHFLHLAHNVSSRWQLLDLILYAFVWWFSNWGSVLSTETKLAINWVHAGTKYLWFGHAYLRSRISSMLINHHFCHLFHAEIAFCSVPFKRKWFRCLWESNPLVALFKNTCKSNHVSKKTTSSIFTPMLIVVSLWWWVIIELNTKVCWTLGISGERTVHFIASWTTTTHPLQLTNYSSAEFRSQ